MLFIISGQGPHRRLSDLTSSPWSEVWFDKSESQVICASDEGLESRLIYILSKWGAGLGISEISAPTPQMGSDIDRMTEDSDCATWAILGWLGDARGLEADMNIELLALRYQKQLVEEDSQVGGSNRLSESIVETSSHYVRAPSLPTPIHGADSVDADLVDRLEGLCRRKIGDM